VTDVRISRVWARSCVAGLLFGAAVVVSGGAGDVRLAAQSGSARRSVWDGVYSEAQGRRGKETYDYSCATCHAPDLSGDAGRDVPALYGDDFIGEWNKKTVKDLLDLVSRMMPKDSPGSLKAETYLDVVAYLLQANEFPAGAQDLTQALAGQVGIDRNPPARQ
jgi:mono/diheme cytochrome c family protein